MSSVTEVAKNYKQPKGGFLSPLDLDVFEILDDNEGSLPPDEENLRPHLVGMAVEYLTRYALGSLPEKAFHISLKGARIADEYDEAKRLLNLITGINKQSVSSACKIVGYDVCFRAGLESYRPVSHIIPDETTINHISLMVNRSVEFCRSIGPITQYGFDFPGGYTARVHCGDGDFLTKEVLLDIKTLKDDPNATHTLQLLLYYVMGRNSLKSELFQSIKYLVIFNPRKNKYYSFPVERIPPDTIETITRDVIQYGPNHKKQLESWEKGSSPQHYLNNQKKKTNFKPGDLVYHQQFGEGVVENVLSLPQLLLVNVQFGEKIGKKKIVSDKLSII